MKTLAIGVSLLLLGVILAIVFTYDSRKNRSSPENFVDPTHICQRDVNEWHASESGSIYHGEDKIGSDGILEAFVLDDGSTECNSLKASKGFTDLRKVKSSKPLTLPPAPQGQRKAVLFFDPGEEHERPPHTLTDEELQYGKWHIQSGYPQYDTAYEYSVLSFQLK